MTDKSDFFPKDPEKQLAELKDRLYERLEATRILKWCYDKDRVRLSSWDIGYSSGLIEEILWLEKLLDDLIIQRLAAG